MVGQSPKWLAALLWVSVFVVALAVVMACATFAEEHSLRRIRSTSFPVVGVDLSSPGVTDVPVKLGRRRTLAVRLIVPGPVLANEATLGDFDATIEILRANDGKVMQQEKFWGWRDREGGSVAYLELMPLQPNDYVVRLTIIEPAASLGAGRIEMYYVIETVEGMLIPEAKLLAAWLGALGLTVLATAVLLMRRLRRLPRGHGFEVVSAASSSNSAGSTE